VPTPSQRLDLLVGRIASPLGCRPALRPHQREGAVNLRRRVLAKLADRRNRAALVLAAALAALTLGPASDADAATRSCAPVVNPYAGTRYEGVDLRGIRATGVSCSTARRVARRAHYKALGLPLPPDGIRRLTWNGWRVTGDLRGSSDRYVATRGSRRVRWLF
jgi:hypothetical protein